MAAVDIREMRLDEALAAAAVGVLGTAMVDNPIHVAVFQGAGLEQRDHLTTMFTANLIDLPGEVFLAEQEGALVGVLRSYPCGAASRDSEDDQPKPDKRVRHWFEVWDRHDPEEAHRHLGPVGVLPTSQGEGIGSRLMDRFCASVDAIGEPAFLETDKPENVRFYQRHGFEVIAEEEIYGVVTFFMWRSADSS